MQVIGTQVIVRYKSDQLRTSIQETRDRIFKTCLVGNMDYPAEETRHLYAPYLQESHFYHPDHFYYSARLQQGSYKKKTKRVPKEKKKIVKTSEG